MQDELISLVYLSLGKEIWARFIGKFIRFQAVLVKAQWHSCQLANKDKNE